MRSRLSPYAFALLRFLEEEGGAVNLRHPATRTLLPMSDERLLGALRDCWGRGYVTRTRDRRWCVTPAGVEAANAAVDDWLDYGAVTLVEPEE